MFLSDDDDRWSRELLLLYCLLLCLPCCDDEDELPMVDGHPKTARVVFKKNQKKLLSRGGGLEGVVERGSLYVGDDGAKSTDEYYYNATRQGDFYLARRENTKHRRRRLSGASDSRINENRTRQPVVVAGTRLTLGRAVPAARIITTTRRVFGPGSA